MVSSIAALALRYKVALSPTETAILRRAWETHNHVVGVNLWRKGTQTSGAREYTTAKKMAEHGLLQLKDSRKDIQTKGGFSTHTFTDIYTLTEAGKDLASKLFAKPGSLP